MIERSHNWLRPPRLRAIDVKDRVGTIVLTRNFSNQILKTNGYRFFFHAMTTSSGSSCGSATRVLDSTYLHSFATVHQRTIDIPTHGITLHWLYFNYRFVRSIPDSILNAAVMMPRITPIGLGCTVPVDKFPGRYTFLIGPFSVKEVEYDCVDTELYVVVHVDKLVI
ncbi:MAG TPA: hypothetical protein VK503_08070 [Candidatus Bathyarchaeia archaeon]|nr:hypothetical protein [Candidatus Bathyarchaeia archaeon]